MGVAVAVCIMDVAVCLMGVAEDSSTWVFASGAEPLKTPNQNITTRATITNTPAMIGIKFTFFPGAELTG